jgi:hypothetical protein
MEKSFGDMVIIWANGWLAAGYWLLDNAAWLVVLACAGWILLRHDRQVQRVTGQRPLRYSRGSRVIASNRSMGETLATLLLWTLANFLAAAPIPAIGAAMWLAFGVALHLIPQERDNLLFRQKMMIAIYALLVMVFRLALSYSPTPDQLMRLLGGSGDASAVFETVRGGLMPYALLLLWGLYPLGYFAMLAQRFMINRGSLFKARRNIAEVIGDLRTRGEDH